MEGACSSTHRYRFNKGVIAYAPFTILRSLRSLRCSPSPLTRGGMKKARRAAVIVLYALVGLRSIIMGVTLLSPGMLAMFARKRAERRRSARSTIPTRAWIRLDDGFAVRPCRVIDLSPTGARLSIEGEIPKSFALLLSLNSAGRKARIKWRRGNQVGIQFA